MKVFLYMLPIVTLGFVLLPFAVLPNLRYCALPGDEKIPGSSPGKISRRQEALFLILLCLVYAFTAFFNLGGTASPESFVPMEGCSAIIELDSDTVPAHIMLFTGVGSGTIDIECSPDGSLYEPSFSFDQNYTQVLKWHDMGFQAASAPKAVRLSCSSGSPYLGEICFLDENYQLIAAHSDDAPELCDEQELFPMYQNFMNSTYFDEIYHARTAWEQLNSVEPYEISHPPLGKTIIGLGITIFGMSPFGWRFMGTLSGLAMLPIMYFLLKRLFGRDIPAALGTVLLASDFMHFAQTRIATIDSFAVFFILLMYLFMHGFYMHGSLRDLALSGLFFGLGAAGKWTCIYAGAGLAVLWLMYWIRRFSSCGKKSREYRRSLLKAFILNCLFCLVFFVALPCLIYYLSYIPYGQAAGVSPFSREYTKIVLDNQEFMFSYHMGVQDEHPYSSRWYQWILNIRPILYYLHYFEDGSVSSIGAFLNPLLCWAGLLAIVVTGYEALFRKDRKAAFIFVAYLAQLLPWLFIKRLTFEYHYFASSVFLAAAIAYVFDILRLNRKNCLRYALPFAAASVLLFVLFYPVLSGRPVSREFSENLLGWFPTWPF